MDKDKPAGVLSRVTSYNRPQGRLPGTDRLFWSRDKRILERWVKKWNSKLAKSHPKFIVLMGPYEGASDEISATNKKELPLRTYLLHRKKPLSGEDLEEARPTPNPQTNRPEVALMFNMRGAAAFDELTKVNVGNRFAVVLEDRVRMAPVINSRISQGNAVITLGGLKSYDETLQEAKDMAFVLKSGSLPAPVEILYEKTVGPALGADSIRRGVSSLLVGFVLVILFMLFYYRGSGFNANLALLLNILFVGAVMASFGAVLTLPGLAGILLTVGMAVDANILIFERIREELSSGKTVRIAVQNGYGKAFTTILDANITTAIAGIVLYQYGSGPVRGFAVTLLIGIVCSVFTALFVTRLVF
ncbi:MAG: protein translocase subunit SecD, partial [Myxococcota bacterium]